MISASIVLYNTKKADIEMILSSFCPSENKRLFVVDNSEKDDAKFNFLNRENIEYYFVGKNLGYGAAHNIAIKKAINIGSDYHIVLNPDIKFSSSILDEMIVHANKNQDVVYMLPKVVYPNGDLQYLCKLLPTPLDLFIRRFLPNVYPIKILNDRYVLKKAGYDKIINPPCLSGCFMFLRTESLKKFNILFDEQFFMYFEDFDLIRRLHRIGKTIYYPNVTIIHNHSKESYKSKKMLKIHISSAIKYFNKYGWFWDAERRTENKKILKDIYV